MSDHTTKDEKLLFIDCLAGIAGDMMLGALLDLDSEVSDAIHASLDKVADLSAGAIAQIRAVGKNCPQELANQLVAEHLLQLIAAFSFCG